MIGFDYMIELFYGYIYFVYLVVCVVVLVIFDIYEDEGLFMWVIEFV